MDSRAQLTARLAPYLRYGPAAGFLAVAKRGIKRWVQAGSIIVFEQALSGGEPPSLPGVDFAEIGPDDLPGLARAFGRPLADLRARLRRGDRGFAVWEAGGAPLHMRWTSTRPTWIPEVALWVVPRAGECYSYDAITAPAARGRRIYDAARRHVDRLLLDEGISRRLVYVRGDNHGMWRALLASSVKPLYRLYYLQLPAAEPIVLGRYGAPLADRI